jgi:hypothetical protein
MMAILDKNLPLHPKEEKQSKITLLPNMVYPVSLYMVSRLMRMVRQTIDMHRNLTKMGS